MLCHKIRNFYDFRAQFFQVFGNCIIGKFFDFKFFGGAFKSAAQPVKRQFAPG
jgi:hypothetical protein